MFNDRKLLVKTVEMKILNSVLGLPSELSQSYESRIKDTEKIKELKK